MRSDVRIDRFLSLYLMQPMLRKTTGLRIPVLMYHDVSDVDESDVPPYYRVAVTPAVFERQVLQLKEAGYRSVTLGEAVRCLEQGTDRRQVVITFDDGLESVYSQAFPILGRYGFKASVYPVTSLIDGEDGFKGRPCLSWRQLLDLRSQGWEIGSHTATHPRLVDESPERVRRELSESKDHIEQGLGEAIEGFSYPYAFPEAHREFVRFLRDTLVQLGYRQGVSTRIGRASPQDDPLFLKRLPVNSQDDSMFFRAKLDGAYDWLNLPQRISKKLRHLAGS